MILLIEFVQLQVSHVLWAIFHDHPDIIYAPLLYPLCSLFLHFLNVESAYQSLMNLLLSHDLHFIGTTKADKVRDAYVLVKLTNKFGILPQRSFGAQVRSKNHLHIYLFIYLFYYNHKLIRLNNLIFYSKTISRCNN